VLAVNFAGEEEEEEEDELLPQPASAIAATSAVSVSAIRDGRRERARSGLP
jgi:hypothetical protein